MKKIILAILCIVVFCFTTSCSTEKLSMEKLRDIEFTVVKEEDIPKEFLSVIQEKDKSPFKLTYADQGELYIAEGYGRQKTSGYSIEVKDCYETENAVYVHTNLIGPAKEEKIVEAETFPYIVIKMEFIDKNVVFQ